MPGQPKPFPRDNDYWTALFQEEDRVESSSNREIDIHWSTLNEPSGNGRSPYTDKDSDNDPWHIARTSFEADETLELDVTGYNKGGLLVQWQGLQGFVPASQLADFTQFHREGERSELLKKWVNKPLKLKIVEIEPTSNRLILSERAAFVKAATKAEILSRTQSGDILDGEITNLTEFGAFVDLGGVEGLIHISELSWSRVRHPGDVVNPGQKVTVKVLRIDQYKERVALSLKRMKHNPWKNLEDRYQPGQIVEGIVSNIVNYGAFVQVEDELEGLIHM